MHVQKSIVTVAMYLLLAGGELPIHVFSRPSGFWLMSSKDVHELYGATSPDADWVVVQWNNPSDLPPFASNRSRNKTAMVSIELSNYSIEQTTADLPCYITYPSGQSLVDEFDLMVQPNTSPEQASLYKNIAASYSITNIKHIKHEVTVQLYEAQILDTSCTVTQAALITAIVLTNRVAKQTFFYQLQLGMLRAVDSRADWSLPDGFWFFRGTNKQLGTIGQFGYGDSISYYGIDSVVYGKETIISIDCYDKIKALIYEAKEYGMDQNLENWAITGTYHGQSAFGHVKFGSKWGEFVLTLY